MVEETMERRKYPRFNSELPMSFSGENKAGKGLVHNLSQQGCLVESTAIVSPGECLKLTIQVSSSDAPLEVELATVRWVKGQVFGAELLYMRPVEHERLCKHLAILMSPEPERP